MILFCQQDHSDGGVTVEVTVRSNSFLIGDTKTVSLLFQSSSRHLVPYVLPRTCKNLKFDVCDQSGNDFILYEFSLVSVDLFGIRNNPVICNVVVHSAMRNTLASSDFRFDYVPKATFHLAGV